MFVFLYSDVKKFNGVIVTLEHRYYGKSQPFDSWTTENLQFLSSKQAIFDLAHFVNWFRESFEKSQNVSNTKIFNIGCSYSGALSGKCLIQKFDFCFRN